MKKNVLFVPKQSKGMQLNVDIAVPNYLFIGQLGYRAPKQQLIEILLLGKLHQL